MTVTHTIAGSYGNLPYGETEYLDEYRVAQMGMQATVVATKVLGMQARVSLYNTNRLRILCDFASRGTTGVNWTASSTAAGDFGVNNLNTDIVEQVWRSVSTVKSGIRLECDTEVPQGVALDTFAMLEHNITTSAVVRLIGSNSPTFATEPFNEVLTNTETNTFWIAPTLPNNQYRYWRIEIDDPNNPNDSIQVGTVVFGASAVFFGECFTDQITFERKDFSDTVRTEGFTNVANSRAQKNRLSLDFKFLNREKGNWTILKSIFTNERTTLKCLWIPLPSATDMDQVNRFTVFSKLERIPTERHLDHGPGARFVTFPIVLDESL